MEQLLGPLRAIPRRKPCCIGLNNELDRSARPIARPYRVR